LLRTADFFEQSDEEVDKWFSLFDIYIGESPYDQGILLTRLRLRPTRCIPRNAAYR